MGRWIDRWVFLLVRGEIIQIQQKTDHHRHASERILMAFRLRADDVMAFRLRADDGPTLNAGLVAWYIEFSSGQQML